MVGQLNANYTWLKFRQQNVENQNLRDPQLIQKIDL